MKKWLLLILGCSPSLIWGAGAGGINLTVDPRALLRSTNTWTAAQTFSSGTFKGDLTIEGTCTGCGGGGGGSGSLYLEPFGVSVTTFFFPRNEFTAASGSGISTITVRGATGTFTAAQVFDSSNTFNGWIVTSSNVFVGSTVTASGLFVSTNGILVGGVMFTTYMSTVVTRFNNAWTAINSTNAAANVHSSTAQAKILAIALDTGTLKSDAWTAINSTNTAFQTHASTAQLRIAAIALDTTTIDNLLAQRTLIFNEEGSPLDGNVTAVDCVGTGISCAQAGSTVTVTITGGGGGGGGGAAYFDGTVTNSITTFTVTNAIARFSTDFASITVKVPSAYDLVIGTPGTPGVDVYVSSADNFNLALSSLSISGITSGSSVTATILMKSGIYNMHGTTIPAGLRIVTGSSVVWVNDNSSETLTTIYGKVDGVKFDMRNSSVASRYIELKSSSSLTNFEIYNQQWGQLPSAGGTYRYSTIFATAAFNFKLHGTFHGTRWIQTASNYGEQANVMLFNCNDADLSLNVHSSTQANTSSAFFMTANSKNIRWTNSVIRDVGGDFIVLESGSKDFKFERNYVQLARVYGDEGFIMMQSQYVNGAGLSSGTLINNNHFEITDSNDTGRIVRIGANGGTFAIPAVRITNNVVNRTTSTVNGQSRAVLASISVRGLGTVVRDNLIDGLSHYMVDQAADTVSQGNVLNGFPQPFTREFAVGISTDLIRFSVNSSSTIIRNSVIISSRVAICGVPFLGAASLSVGTANANIPLLFVTSATPKFVITGDSSSFSNTVNFSSPIVTVSTLTSVSSGTFNTLTASSFTVAGGTLTVGPTVMIFPSSAPPAATDLVMHWRDGMVYMGGDGFGGGITQADFNTMNATHSTRIQDLSLDTGTIQVTIATHTLVGRDEGVGGADSITTLDFVGDGVTFSQSGSTGTVTIAAGGGGGGSGGAAIYNGAQTVAFSTLAFSQASIVSGLGMSTVTYIFPREYDVVIGTAGALGVDYANNNFTAAMNQVLSDRGASMTSTNTVNLRVFVRSGVYDATGSSVGAKTTLFTVPAASGTIFVLNHDSKTIITNYGTVDGFTFDAGSRAFTGRLIELKSNAIFRNNTIIGAQKMANYSTAAIISVENSSNVIITKNWFKEYTACAGQLFQGQCGVIKIYDSTDTYTYDNIFSSKSFRSSMYETIWSTVRSDNSYLYSNLFDGAEGICVSVGSGRNAVIDSNRFEIGHGAQGDSNDYGIVTLDGTDEVPPFPSSSATVVSNNTFIFTSTGGGSGKYGNLIVARPQPSNNHLTGLVIKGNTATSRGRMNWNFYFMQGGAAPEQRPLRTVLKNNDVYNLQNFLLDAGQQTKYLDLGNTLDGIPLTNPAMQDWGYVSTRSINATGFAVVNPTGVYVGTNTIGIVSISTTPDVKRPMLVLSTGTQTLYEFTPTSFTINVSSVYINGVLIVTGTARTDIDITTINFMNTTDGIVRSQMNPGLELLASTVPNGAISTMTVTFSTRTHIFVVIYGSANAGPHAGDLMIYFNGQNNKQGLYNVHRSTTFSVGGSGGTSSQSQSQVSSAPAVGITVFGPDIATSTLREMHLRVFGNEPNRPKVGRFEAVSISTVAGAVGESTGRFSYHVDEQINRIDATFARKNKPWAEASRWMVGSRIHVYGRDD